MTSTPSTELHPGAKLGPYEILSRIGAGGMGQVWKARDTRLDRIVAIKVAAARFTDRFDREARAVAALNHPHICTLYDIGPDYLVMEYVNGAEIRGPLPADQALRLAIQMASALEAAHRSGITHRDLKPANLLVTKSGVKMLDFGLAKPARVKLADTSDETLTGGLTQEGAIVGTLQYMAPEQLQSRPADARADIFSFGCVLYEMLTGKRAFDGSSTASVIAAVLEREPPAAGELVPPALDWVLRRCLAKDPDDRWQTARDLRAALERVSQSQAEAPQTGAAFSGPAWLYRLAPAAIAILAVSTATLAWFHFRETTPEPIPMRVGIKPPAGGRFSGASLPAVSPDGTSVVFEATGAGGKAQLWLRPLNSVTALPLPGTDGGNSPFWSPDGKLIGFFAGGRLKKLNISGGAVTTLANAAIGGGSWSPAGVIVFAATYAGALQQVSASGGTARPVTPVPPNPQPQRSPWFLPDGKHFLYLYGSGQGRFTVHIGSLNPSDRDRVLPEAADTSAIAWVNGNMLFQRGATLVARPFDSRNLAFTGDALPVAEQVLGFGTSSNGILVYQEGASALRLMWYDRAGKRVAAPEGEGDLRQMSISPDRRTVAITVRDPANGNVDIWLYELGRGHRTRLTLDPATDAFPVWSPDGRFIVFRSNRNGQFDLYRRAADGSGKDELVYADSMAKVPTSISPDGRNLAYWLQDSKSGNGLGFLPLSPPGAPALPGSAKPDLRQSPEFSQDHPRFSPGGHWVAYESDETGRYEVYVAPYPGPGGKRQISREGGATARWRPDGKELFYLGVDNQLMVAQMDPKGEAKKVEQLFTLQNTNYDVSLDGQRILVLASPDSEERRSLTVVQNWAAGLKK